MDDVVTPVVLAGGSSRRFDDGDKAIATFRGRPLIAHVVDAVEAALPTRPLVAVASSTQRDRLEPAVDQVRFVRDGDGAGPVAGLGAAAEHLSATRALKDGGDASWLLAVPCDTPLITPAAISWICGLHRGEVDAVVPVVGDDAQPLFALYRTAAVLEGLRGESPSSMHDVLETVRDAKRAIPRGSLGATVAQAVRDVDTVEDLARLRREHRPMREVER